VTIFILPKFIRGERRSRTSNGNGNVRLSGSGNVKDAMTTNGGSTAALTAGNDLNEDREEDEHAQCKVHTPTHQQPAAALHNTTEQQSTEQPNNVNLRPRPQQKQQQTHLEKQPMSRCARDAVSVPHDQCEMDQLSSKLKEKIEAETKNIEEFIDKTVTETVSGIVEFKNDLMRDIEFPKLKLPGSNGGIPLDSSNGVGLRKRNISSVHDNGTEPGKSTADLHHPVEENGAAFLKKEIEVINAVVQQAVPAVLSNGHAK